MQIQSSPYTYKAGIYRVILDGFRSNDLGTVMRHMLDLIVAQNDEPTAVGPSVSDPLYDHALYGASVPCPAEFAHILTFLPKAVIVQNGHPAGGPPHFGVKLECGQFVDCGELLESIKTVERNYAAFPRYIPGIMAGVLYAHFNTVTNGEAIAGLL